MSETEGGSPLLAEQPGKKEIVLSSPLEKSVVFGCAIRQLINDTRHEVNGNLREEGVAENNALREVVKRLAVDLGKDRIYSPQEWLLLGIHDFIPETKLTEWANPTEKPHWTEMDLHKTARYLLEKKKAAESQKAK